MTAGEGATTRDGDGVFWSCTVGVGTSGGLEPGTEACAGNDTRVFPAAFALRAASSTMTDGSLPLVYEAVNSHGWFDAKHSAHGQRPVHRVFFLRWH